jgi:hypothetical protein
VTLVLPVLMAAVAVSYLILILAGTHGLGLPYGSVMVVLTIANLWRERRR